MPSTPAPVEDDEAEKLAAEAEYYGTYGSYEAEIQAWEDRHVQCAEICKVRTIEGARSGEEALCSADGLESTRESNPGHIVPCIRATADLCSRLRSMHRHHLA